MPRTATRPTSGQLVTKGSREQSDAFLQCTEPVHHIDATLITTKLSKNAKATPCRGANLAVRSTGNTFHRRVPRDSREHVPCRTTKTGSPLPPKPSIYRPSALLSKAKTHNRQKFFRSAHNPRRMGREGSPAGAAGSCAFGVRRFIAAFRGKTEKTRTTIRCRYTQKAGP